MQSTEDLAEYERIGLLISRKNSLLSRIARDGYRKYGRGAVFFREAWEDALSNARPFYLPNSEPELDDMGNEIRKAVTLYRPSSEAVVVVVTKRDEVFVARLKLTMDTNPREATR